MKTPFDIFARNLSAPYSLLLNGDRDREREARVLEHIRMEAQLSKDMLKDAMIEEVLNIKTITRNGNTRAICAKDHYDEDEFRRIVGREISGFFQKEKVNFRRIMGEKISGFFKRRKQVSK